MDPSSRESPGSLSEAGSIGLKTCEYCRTTKTPLWRGGPSGPKSLCNACGIRYRKTRRESTAETSPKKEGKGEVDMGLKLQLLGIKSIMKQSSSSSSSIRKRSRSRRRRSSSSSSCFYWVERQQRRNLGEVEKAAVLLMALSSGIFL